MELGSLRVLLLGPPQITVDERPLEVDTRKAVAVLAMLAVEGRRSREQLAAMFWPDSEADRARGALRRTLSVLTTGLGQGWIDADRSALELVGESEIDVSVADSLEQRVEEHEHHGAGCPECREALDELIGLHRGPFLDGFSLRDATEFDAWRDAEAESRRRQLVSALDRRSALEADGGDLDATLETLSRWRSLDVLNEQVYRRLMIVHARRGERIEAVHAYRECVAVLDRELGVSPLEATTRLYQAILDGQPAASPSSAPAARRRAASPAAEAAGDRAAVASSASEELPLVGRDDQLDEAESWLAGQGAVVGVAGEAGIGKTRFVEELEARLHRRDVAVLSARCHRGEESLAFGAVAEAVRDVLRRPDVEARLATLPDWQRVEAARLIPELGPGAPVISLDQEGARLRFLEAVAAVLETAVAASDRPAVMIVEDLHLADAGTVDLLGYLARRLSQRRLRLLLTWRPQDLHADGNLHALLSDPSLRGRLLMVELDRLDAGDVALLCRHALRSRAEPEELALRLQDESDGLPLALVQYLAWLAENPVDVRSAWPLPAGLREVVAERLNELDGAASQIVASAAVLGHGADLDLLVAVSGRSLEETVSALDDLLTRRVMVATRDGGFELAHERLRTVAYEDLSPARRRLLHARAVTALGHRAERRGTSTLAARIAEHARLAGQQERAALWAVRAGDQAQSVFANAEALEHFEAALALTPGDPAAIHRRIARLHVLAGDYGAAFAAYEAAAALAEDETTLTVIEHELGALHIRRREWSAARLHLETALAGSHTTDPARAARIRADVGLVALQRGDLDKAEAQAQEALSLAEEIEDRQALAQARNLAGMIARRRGRTAEAQRQLEHAAALVAHLRDPSAYIAALNNLALTTAEAGEEPRAVELLSLALDRCERQGDRHRQAALLNNLADLHHRRGDEAGAMEHLRRAVSLFAEVGSQLPADGDGSAKQDPEVWKLVEW